MNWGGKREGAGRKRNAEIAGLMASSLSRATAFRRLRQATVTVIDDLWAEARAGRKYRTIYADPPWLYANQTAIGAASNFYNGMTIDELCALPIRDLAAADSHLHLWTTNGFLFECPKLFEAWGFEFRSSFAWVKPQIGLGNYWRNSHEMLLTAIRGNATRFNDKSLRNWMEISRGKHSAKPEQVRRLIERAGQGPRLELFARRAVAGWVCWGDQIERDLLSRAKPG